MQNTSEEFNYDYVLDCIKSGKNISFSRFGDGEWYCIMGREGKNCDGHRYFPDMGQALRDVLQSKPNYFLGIQPFALRVNRGRRRFESLYSINKWVDNEIFVNASKGGRIPEFVEALKGRYVIQVGNEYLKKLNIANDFIEVPVLNCWLSKDEILPEILKHIKKDAVILYSSGMPTKHFIHEVNKLWGNDITQLDCGSVFDYYAGRNSRTYMKRLDHPSL